MSEQDQAGHQFLVIRLGVIVPEAPGMNSAGWKQQPVFIELNLFAEILVENSQPKEALIGGIVQH